MVRVANLKLTETQLKLIGKSNLIIGISDFEILGSSELKLI